MQVFLEPSWKVQLSEEFKKPYFVSLAETVSNEYKKGPIFPNSSNIFQAFSLTPFSKVRVVILGQDPYHGLGQAHGLAFSVEDGVQIPPSLRNIYRELATDVGVYPHSGNLGVWARQGVLLLNATLTVRAGEAGSHQDMGWETFTDAVLQKLSQEREHLVFILWGNYAGAKKQLINESKHLVIESTHPSPLSAHRGFFGSKPFSKANKYLRESGEKPIVW